MAFRHLVICGEHHNFGGALDNSREGGAGDAFRLTQIYIVCGSFAGERKTLSDFQMKGMVWFY